MLTEACDLQIPTIPERRYRSHLASYHQVASCRNTVLSAYTELTTNSTKPLAGFNWRSTHHVLPSVWGMINTGTYGCSLLDTHLLRRSQRCQGCLSRGSPRLHWLSSLPATPIAIPAGRTVPLGSALERTDLKRTQVGR